MADYRFGISLLSKDRFNEAFNEEVMIDKLTGEVLVKSPTGDIISYNYNSRLKSHVSSTKMIANNMSVYGDIISIEMDGVHAPFVMEFDRNYIADPIIIPYANCKKILFNADIDSIKVINDAISHDKINMLVELEFSLYYFDSTETNIATVSLDMNEFNHRVLSLTDSSIVNIVGVKPIAGIKISSFKIKNVVMDYAGEIVINSDTIRPIFNSLFAVIQV